MLYNAKTMPEGHAKDCCLQDAVRLYKQTAQHIDLINVCQQLEESKEYHIVHHTAYFYHMRYLLTLQFY